MKYVLFYLLKYLDRYPIRMSYTSCEIVLKALQEEHAIVDIYDFVRSVGIMLDISNVE
jgi:uncharacterized protein (UPF0128 family)